ncbi:translocator protein-like [Mercenaria mercenaria]|uniref:translocator protein-like n=1 Tax=Mercenaria mercenaria TaxID=6596 RepID=UPI001E1DA8AA|nr:translocator protein-like [Mercenaria mercenaria]
MGEYLRPACAILLPHAGGFLCGYLTHKELKTWFKKLNEPSFAPPDWVFPSATFTSYCCMGYGSYLVWRDCGGFEGGGVLPLAIYATSLALTWTHPPLLCKTKNLGLGVVSMLSVLGARVATAVMFKNVNSTAGYLMLPGLGLVGYATFLSYSRWKNNRTRRD